MKRRKQTSLAVSLNNQKPRRQTGSGGFWLLLHLAGAQVEQLDLFPNSFFGNA